MSENSIPVVVAIVAGVFGAIAGRVFAVEAQNRRAALFAATYIGAGVGLVTALPIGSVLTVLVKVLNSEWDSSALLNALDVTGTAVMWGIASGAAGGLVISLFVIAGFNWWGRPYRAGK
jgi:hypothetical protein